MNSWRLNSIANYVLRQTIANELSISLMDVYKTVKTITVTKEAIIGTKDGKKYKLVLKEI